MSDINSLSPDSETRVQAIASQIHDEHKHKLEEEPEFKPSEELHKKIDESESEEEAKQEAVDSSEVYTYAANARENFAGYFKTSADQRRADASPPLSDAEDARLMELVDELLDDIIGEMWIRAEEVVVHLYLDSGEETSTED